jgi:SAM-dependent methyltransferase
MTVATPKDHYEQLLAEHYVWMMGDFAVGIAAQRALLERIVPPAHTEQPVAVDLGSGPGYQAIALADMGYRVFAVDTSSRLLGELSARMGRRAIVPILGDLSHVDALCPGTWRVVTCMGDTLTHLPSRDAVRSLFALLARRVEPRGTVVLTWRDMSAPLEGLDRIIPVRADDLAVMTCFLEYLPDRVLVHDVISRRTSRGWVTAKSVYPKVRLAHTDVSLWLEEAGFRVTHDERAPMSMVAAVRGG